MSMFSLKINVQWNGLLFVPSIFLLQWQDAIEETESGFPSCNIFKASFQVLYNSLKGGLDANTEQVASITPGVKVGFKQKYVLRLISALVTNAWRSLQLLNYGIETKLKKRPSQKQNKHLIAMELS